MSACGSSSLDSAEKIVAKSASPEPPEFKPLATSTVGIRFGSLGCSYA